MGYRHGCELPFTGTRHGATRKGLEDLGRQGVGCGLPGDGDADADAG